MAATNRGKETHDEFLMSYNIFSWNIRGVAAKGVPLLLKDMVNRHNVSCLAILEPRILWQTNWGNIEVLSSHRQFVHTRISPKGNLPSLLVTFVYGSPNYAVRDCLWRELRILAANMTEPCCVIGDFNAYLHASDKMGGGPPNLISMNKFKDCLDECSLSLSLFLSDLGFIGPPFTWEGRGVKERIDWALGTDRMLASFPEPSVHHLPKMKSDHKPLLLQLDGGSSRGISND
ncbi:uncharacterized protein LOC130736183 [Lotus japonicus]|uniref:uncharacterized protein LOC130736183 n=1 Tax=Lotus japonicus TaxID=34305 RepID=UPI00258D3947|nr:uncharacterized protein LOC130736183 [Lotus japonicus]